MAKKEKQGEEKTSVVTEILQWIQSLTISVAIVALIVIFVGRPVTVLGVSMEPTFLENDKVISTNLHGDFKYGDIVVIKRKNDTPIIKRVIGVSGDKIDIDFEKGDVFVNDVLLNEPYINEPTTKNMGTIFPVTIPKGYVFVMGDNRNHSDDSRNPTIGLVDQRNIFGKVIFRFFPLDRIGIIGAVEKQSE